MLGYNSLTSNIAPKFSSNRQDRELMDLVNNTDQKTLAVWAIDCAERVLFEEKYPADHRPRTALNTLQNWIDTGIFKMSVIRKASLDSHTAARASGSSSHPGVDVPSETPYCPDTCLTISPFLTLPNISSLTSLAMTLNIVRQTNY